MIPNKAIWAIKQIKFVGGDSEVWQLTSNTSATMLNSPFVFNVVVQRGQNGIKINAGLNQQVSEHTALQLSVYGKA